MAVALDTSAKCTAFTSGTTTTIVGYVAAATNPYMRVSAFLFDNTVTLSGVTWNLSATGWGRLGSKATTGETLDVWGAKGLSGTGTIVATSAFTSGNAIVLDSWTGVDQTTPTGTTVTNSGSTSGNVGATATLPSSGAVAGSLIDHYAYTPVTSNQTLLQRITNNAGNKGLTLISGYSLATGALTFHLTEAYPWAAVSTPMNAAGGGGGFTAVNRRSLGPRVGSRSNY